MITCSMTNEDGITVLEGQTRGLVPGVKEQEVLVRMLAEGDPTNGAAGAGNDQP